MMCSRPSLQLLAVAAALAVGIAQQPLCVYDWENHPLASGGVGWALVRRRDHTQTTWHPVNDDLRGATAYGTYPAANAETAAQSFSLQFDQNVWGDVIVATGDRTHWAWYKKSALSTSGGGVPVQAEATGFNPNPHTLIWYYRGASSPEDPWISDRDHFFGGNSGGNDGHSDHSMLYGEGDFHGIWMYHVINHVGANVWVRSPDLCPPSPICTLPPSLWLETEFAPVLNTVASGFTIAGVKDRFRIVFEEHRKYFDVVPSSDGLSEASGAFTVAIEENSAVINAVDEECYDTYTVDVDWATLVPKCARSEEGTGLAGFVVFTCKLEVDGKETLDPIRTTSLTRTMHHELPFIVKFPKQVAASVGDLSAFQPPGVQAAVVRQEVLLDVNDIANVDAKIRLFTSVQWPFKLDTASPAVVSVPANLVAESFVNFDDCVDPNVGDQANPSVDDANACSQVWLLDLQVDASTVCELDGDYQVTFEAQCQPSFAAQTDCPLVQDDLGQIDNVFTVDFKIDSENFCAQVVDSVDIAATLTVWKDHAHTVSASNFIQDQTAYFVAKATSTKVTIVETVVDDIQVEITGPPNAGLLSFYLNGAPGVDVTPALSLAVENWDHASNGNADEAWFQFIVTELPFSAPLDGSADFDVTVTLSVEFKDAQGVVMLEKRQFKLLQAASQQPIAASAQFAVGPADEETAASPLLSAFGVSVATALAAVTVA